MMTVLVPDIRAYERFLHDTLLRLPGVTQLRSAILVKEVKAEVRLSLETPAAKPPRARRARACIEARAAIRLYPPEPA